MRGDPATATAHYRRALEADPSFAAAATHLQQIGPPTEAPPPAAKAPEPETEYQELVIDLEDPGAVHAPQPKVPSIDFEKEEPAPPPPAAAPAPATPPAPHRRRPLRPPLTRPRPRRLRRAPPPASDEQQLETLIVEAEVFAKYGLIDKAIERLFSLVRRRPDLLKARERLVELLAESKNPGLAREAESLAAEYAEKGQAADSSRILALAGLTAGAGGSDLWIDAPPAAAPKPPAGGMEVEFEEFDVGPPRAAAAGRRTSRPAGGCDRVHRGGRPASGRSSG